MKKILLNKSEKKALINEREKAIVESFSKTFNSIKRIDENELKEERPISARYGEDPTPEQSAGIDKFVKDFLDKKDKEKKSEIKPNDTKISENDGEDYEAASRGVEYGINPYQELSPEEQKVLDDILNGTINEGLDSVLQKVKQYASKGMLTAGIIAALLATPKITSAQQSQIKQAANIENTQGMNTGISKMDNMALFNKVVNLIKQSPEKAVEWVKKGDNGNSMIGSIIKTQNMQQQNHKDGKTFGGYLKNDKNSAATEGFLSFMTTQTGNAQIGGMNFR